jgi:hypothetical protein
MTADDHLRHTDAGEIVQLADQINEPGEVIAAARLRNHTLLPQIKEVPAAALGRSVTKQYSVAVPQQRRDDVSLGRVFRGDRHRHTPR